MPVTPFEIMLSKVWSMALAVLLASLLSFHLVVMGLMRVPVAVFFAIALARFRSTISAMA